MGEGGDGRRSATARKGVKVENRNDLSAINDRMTETWKRMVLARQRGDWGEYWAYRQAWLAAGRLLSLLQQEVAREAPEQLTLVPPATGRAHDAAS